MRALTHIAPALLIGFLAAPPLQAQRPPCPDGAAAAARAALASLPAGTPADDMLLRRGLTFEPVTRTQGGIFLGIIAAETRHDWRAFQGGSELRKHEALCAAGDARLAEELHRLDRTRRVSALASLGLLVGFTVGAFGAMESGDGGDSDCVWGLEAACPARTRSFATVGYASLVGIWIPLGIGIRAANSYKGRAPQDYARAVVSRYNEELQSAVQP